MAERSKTHLKQEFRDGERPTGADFGDLIDSFINKLDDAVTVDPVNRNLNIPAGLNLADATVGKPGTLRFNGGNVQFFNGAVWGNVGGNSGPFLPVAGGPHFAYAGGNIGIGNFPAPPLNRLDVNLGSNELAGERVRFGSAAIANGQGGSVNMAQFSHINMATGNNTFALRQGPAGDVNINAPTGQPIAFTHNRLTARMFINTDGIVIVGNSQATIADNTHTLQVHGNAAKNVGGGTWFAVSDERAKQNVRNFEDGLEKLMKVRTVRFNYNGKYNTNPEFEEFGVIGQEIREIFPYMTATGTISDDGSKKEEAPVMFNSSPLIFVMVNAIQELTQRVQNLEGRLKKLEGKK